MNSLSVSRAWTIARTDLRQLRQARDFWLPLMIVGALFFIVIPAILLAIITNISDVKLVKQLNDRKGGIDLKTLRGGGLLGGVGLIPLGLGIGMACFSFVTLISARRLPRESS